MDLLAGFIALVFFVVMGLAPFAILVLVWVTLRRRKGQTRTSAGPLQPLGAADSARVSALLAQRQKIGAIKVVRDATGMSLADAKHRVDHWWDSPQQPSVPAHQPAPSSGTTAVSALPAEERVRIEAAAIVATSGWHTAEAFLREQRGLTAEAAKALLDALS